MTKGYAKSFKDLRVYQKARDVSRAVFRLSKDFPKDEMYSLTDQIRRAARSVGAQIAEAWGERRYEKHFVSKLTDADSEPSCAAVHPTTPSAKARQNTSLPPMTDC